MPFALKMQDCDESLMESLLKWSRGSSSLILPAGSMEEVEVLPLSTLGRQGSPSMHPKQYLLNVTCAGCGIKLYQWANFPQSLYAGTVLWGVCDLCKIVEDFAS
jgi:hypothetical protein